MNPWLYIADAALSLMVGYSVCTSDGPIYGILMAILLFSFCAFLIKFFERNSVS
jgi:hypothetical protein